MKTSTQLIVLYDGECGLCDRSVQWLLDHDSKGAFFYSPLQGETAADIFSRNPLPEGLDSIVFVRKSHEAEQLYWYSNAAVEITRELSWPWRFFSYFRVVPRFFRDWLYRLVARNRLRFFGKVDSCRLPDLQVQQRFLP